MDRLSRSAFDFQLTAPLVLLLAFAVRIYGLGWHGMTYDEAASVAFALPSAGHILTYPQGAIYESPPLFYLLLHFWQALAGQSPFGLRFLPAALSLLQVPLVFQLGRRLFGSSAGLLAALVTAVSVIQVYYAQEVRMYTLVPLLSLVATYAFVRMAGVGEREEKHGRARSIAYQAVYVVAMALAIFGHYYAGLVLVAHNLYALVAWRRGQLSLGSWVLVQTLTLAGPLVYLAFASGVMTTIANVAGGTDTTANLPRLRGLWLDFALGNVSTELRRSPLAWLLLALLGLGLTWALVGPRYLEPGAPRTVSGGFSPLRFRPTRLKPAGIFLVLYLLAPLAVAVVLPYRLAPRYLMTLAPAYYLAIGVGLAVLRPVWPALVAGLALVLGANGYTLSAYRDIVKNDYQRLTTVIQAEEQPGDVILLSAPRQHLLLRYYYHGSLPFRPVPVVPLPPSAEVDAPRLDPARTETDLAEATTGVRRVWFLLSGEDETDPKGLAERWLNGHAAFQFEERAQRGRLRLYEFPSADTTPLHPLVGQFGDVLALDGVRLPSPPVAAGERLQVQIGWRVLSDLPTDLKFTLRLLAAPGERAAQRDDLVGGGYMPPGGRPAGSHFVDFLSLPVPPGTAPGRYTLAVGLYRGEGVRDLPWQPASSAGPLPGGEVTKNLAPLGQVDVGGARQASTEAK